MHAGNIPMFPRNLADGLFSLRMGQPTAAVSVHMTIQSDGSLDDFGLVASTVNPSRKLTYAELNELLDVTMPEQEPTLWALHEVCPCCCLRMHLLLLLRYTLCPVNVQCLIKPWLYHPINPTRYLFTQS